MLFHAEALGEIQGVEIPVPGKDAALAEKPRNFRWMVMAQPERQSRAALVKAILLGDAKDVYAWNRLQASDQSGQQICFVGMGCAVCRLQRFAAVPYGRVTMPPQRRNVIHSSADSGPTPER